MARSYTVVRSWREPKLWPTKCVKLLWLDRGFNQTLIGAFTSSLELEATVANVIMAYSKFDKCLSLCFRVSRPNHAPIANYDIVFEED